MAEPLDPLTLPLHGSRLIEASAGTGKTWTVAALVLRLVLGHGAPPGRAPLVPAQILVVTFTRAATRELSERIRDRLVQAAAVFQGRAPLPAGDPFLAALLAAWPDDAGRAAAGRRLALAADAMDEAAVMTLDAWCQRIVRDGLGTAAPPWQGEVEADVHETLREAARDHWRTTVQPLQGDALALARRLWPTPDHLVQDVLDAGDLELPVADPAPLDEQLARHLDRQRALRAGWPQRLDALHAWLTALIARKPSGFKAQQGHVDSWLDNLRRWATTLDQPMPKLSDAGRQRLNPQGVREALRVPVPESEWPDAVHRLPALLETLEQLPAPEPAWRAAAVWAIRDRVRRQRARHDRWSHADIQRQVAEALDPSRGIAAAALREQLLQRWPVALVDEFHDTSPLQLAILERCYGLQAPPDGHALLLIGDPKQSIYAFRGADIHSYLQARRATEGRHYVLDTNRRSTAGLVQAVNALFGHAERQRADGAFRFGRGVHGGVLPFEPVRPNGRPEQLWLHGEPAPSVQAVLDAAPESGGRSRDTLARRCAQVLARWLDDEGSGYGAAADAAPLRRLQPQDVAVLVRSRHEARLVLDALALRGVPAVFLSQNDSVFDTREAEDLRWWLEAAARPQDMAAVRAAMGCGLTDLPTERLLALADDDLALAEAAADWEALHRCWQRQGVLAMLRLALHRLGAAQRWVARPDGERRLTNVLHLAELLQSASQGRAAAGGDGVTALLRWYRREQQAAAQGLSPATADDRIIRLERDEQAVRVITVHKSKGLQFPVVMLPFATHQRDASQGPTPWLVRVPGGDGQMRVVVGPDAAAQEQAQLEASREDLRLFYVAATRAEHHLWLGISLHLAGTRKRPGFTGSALGLLLDGWGGNGAPPGSPQAVTAALQAWAAAAPGVAWVRTEGPDDPAAQPPHRLRAVGGHRPLQPPPPLGPVAGCDWSVSSYSKLVQGLSTSGPAAAAGSGASRPDAESADDLPWLTAPALRLDEPAVPSAAAVPGPAPTAPADAPWHRFPRGALAGHFLHGQLEWLAERRFGLPGHDGLRQALLRRCERQDWGGPRAVDTADWLEAVCQTVLPPLGASLQQLGPTQPELEFWLPLARLDPAVLDDACRQHLFPGRSRPALGERQLQGLLMGFADLVFLHAGQAWVLDYKSNALGPGDEAYHTSALETAMLDHRYDVQAALYALALHRLLRVRRGAAGASAVPLGGALFWFLRGLAAPGAGCCHLTVPPALLDALEAMLEPWPAERGA
jgi:exodeoxyribonuclease V beta subunit